ncbi:MAG: MFS transporter [Pseudomonadales bacterium]
MNRYLRVAAWQGLEGNLLKSPVLAFFQTFLVLMPVIVPYLAGLGLTMQQILTTQACFSAVIVVMEVPSGYVADRLGRRLALLAGTAFLAAGFLTLWWADSFVDILVFEGLLGVGASMISGADLALLYDTELALGRDGESTTAVANLYTMHAVSEAAAAIACSLLLLLSMRAVIVVQVVAGLVPLLVALTLVEPPVRKDELAMPLRVREVVTHMVGGDPVLRWTVLSLALWPLTTFFAVWILQPQWQAAGVPLHLFGYLWAALMLIAGLAGRWAERLERRLGSARLLLLVGALPVLGFVGMATTPLLATLLFAAGFTLREVSVRWS